MLLIIINIIIIRVQQEQTKGMIFTMVRGYHWMIEALVILHTIVMGLD